MDFASHARDMATSLEPKYETPYGVVNTLRDCADEIDRLRTALAAAERELDETRLDLDWTTKHVKRWDVDGFLYQPKERPFRDESRFVHHDGTPTGLRAAVRKARKGETA